MRTSLIAALAAAFAVLFSAFPGGSAMATEEPRFTLVQQEGAFEVRRYPAILVAEVTVAGERGEAANRAFRPLADYIFGANIARENIGMTAPVTQSRSGERIGMTAPVTQAADGDNWVVQFIMPDRYTMQTLPAPRNPDIRLRETPGRDVAVVRFSGFATREALTTQLARLQAFMARAGLQARGEPLYAFYDPPFTLPFLRRNEILIDIQR